MCIVKENNRFHEEKSKILKKILNMITVSRSQGLNEGGIQARIANTLY
jgi:hypothetical protein